MAVFKLYVVHSGHELGPLGGNAMIMNGVVGHKNGLLMDADDDQEPDREVMYGVNEEMENDAFGLMGKDDGDLQALCPTAGSGTESGAHFVETFWRALGDVVSWEHKRLECRAEKDLMEPYKSDEWLKCSDFDAKSILNCLLLSQLSLLGMTIARWGMKASRVFKSRAFTSVYFAGYLRSSL
ncbi:hypothetical protein MLD38_038488 [Melastoma candidum]|uniref:Uncharacterized protein n=1 Tax=Melastoma candidum TaxID=119954 RepID=A0ACB9KZX1_9MYRT|nr:hypothetical protein MLD38_038488 [Melastoma candidum]